MPRAKRARPKSASSSARTLSDRPPADTGCRRAADSPFEHYALGPRRHNPLATSSPAASPLVRYFPFGLSLKPIHYSMPRLPVFRVWAILRIFLTAAPLSGFLSPESRRYSFIPRSILALGNGGHDLLVASAPDDFAAKPNRMESPLRKIIAATRVIGGLPISHCLVARSTRVAPGCPSRTLRHPLVSLFGGTVMLRQPSVSPESLRVSCCRASSGRQHRRLDDDYLGHSRCRPPSGVTGWKPESWDR